MGCRDLCMGGLVHGALCDGGLVPEQLDFVVR